LVLRLILLLLGSYACSTSAIWIKRSDVPPTLLAAYRLLIAAVALTPLFARDLVARRRTFRWKQLRPALLPGIVLGVHAIAWNWGADETAAANATLIVTMVPIAMPFFLFVLIREKLTGPELAGTAVALAGVVVLGAADFNISAKHFAGDAICFASMLLYALYLALGRKNRGFPSIWLYVVPMYFVGGLICLAAALFKRGEPVTYNASEVVNILGLALVSTAMGHSILNYCLRHMRGQVVSIVNLFQFVYAGIMAVIIWPKKEVPSWAFYPASALVVAGAIIVLKARRGTGQLQQEQENIMTSDPAETPTIVTVGEGFHVRQAVDNIAWIDLGEYAIVVDTLEQAHLEDEVFEAIGSTLGPTPIRYVLNTHTHYDHMALNAAFKRRCDAEIINQQTSPLPAEGRWFEGAKRKALMLPMPGCHTSQDCVVWIPQDRALFTGDIFGWGLIPLSGSLNAKTAELLLDTYKRMIEYGADVVIPGHGPVCTNAELIRWVEYFHWLVQRASQACGEDKSESQIMQEIAAPDDMKTWWRFLQWKHEDSLRKVLEACRRGRLGG
jgi:drug/metabolite transporter (DMT)-like permease/glyoxylase-like metal-dependent hydrolase (beta-lactamase superfamily II)